MTEWQPIETIPRNGDQVLVLLYFRENNETMKYYNTDIASFSNGRWEGRTYNIDDLDIVGWSKIPEIPKSIHNENHECKNSNLKCIFTDSKNGFVLYVKSYDSNGEDIGWFSITTCNYCPFCGMKSEGI